MSTNYTPHEIKLANEFADILDDKHSLSFHLKNARKYKEEYLRSILMQVMSTPDHKIEKSRARYYTWLINQSSSDGDSRY